MSSKKPHMNLIVAGHVDHGKSTTTGHLLTLLGIVDERKMKEIEEEARKRFPKPEHEVDRRNWIALQKFGLLMECLEKKTPTETILELL